MYQIGDGVVYPMHGAGKIKAIEDREISGEKQRYYIIEMSINNMDLMIPEKKMSSSSIRPVTDLSALKNILTILQHGESDRSLVWKQRYKMNLEKIKTGNLKEEAEVVRDLMTMKKEKSLNGSEKTMLDNAHDFLFSELDLIEGITEHQMKCFGLN